MAKADAAPDGPLAPLSVPVFRRIWLANLASNFGYMIQNVGAAWLMTLIADSDEQVALVQASTTLPIMVFALIAGAVADSYNRRRVLLAAQLFMFAVSIVLAVAAYNNWLNAWSLLGLTFLIGAGQAFNIPAWQASVRDFVGKDLLPGAVLLNGVGFNVVRSVAPAIGGSIVAAVGAAAAFIVNAVSYVGLLGVLWAWSGPKEPPTDKLREPADNRHRLGRALCAHVAASAAYLCARLSVRRQHNCGACATAAGRAGSAGR